MQCETMNNMQGTLLKFSLLQFKWQFDFPIKEQFVQIFNYIYKYTVVYYQCCVLIGWVTSRLFVIAHE